jgi:hypothetical protein
MRMQKDKDRRERELSSGLELHITLATTDKQ